MIILLLRNTRSSLSVRPSVRPSFTCGSKKKKISTHNLYPWLGKCGHRALDASIACIAWGGKVSKTRKIYKKFWSCDSKKKKKRSKIYPWLGKKRSKIYPWLGKCGHLAPDASIAWLGKVVSNTRKLLGPVTRKKKKRSKNLPMARKVRTPYTAVHRTPDAKIGENTRTPALRERKDRTSSKVRTHNLEGFVELNRVGIITSVFFFPCKVTSVVRSCR